MLQKLNPCCNDSNYWDIIEKNDAENQIDGVVILPELEVL